MIAPPPPITIVIPTRDRVEPLASLLESLGASKPGWLASIVIVDDSPSPTDPSARFPHLPIDYRWSRERLFVSRAKNVGLAAVASPLAFYVDDDNRIPAATVPRLLEVLRAGERIGAVMPSVLYLRRPDLVWVYATPFQKGGWNFDLLGRNQVRRPELESRLLPTDALPNGALYRTEALRAVGGFDERYTTNSSAPMCRQLKLAGYDVWADSGAFLLHDVEPPGVAWYWVEHVARDPERTFHEVADWFRFRRELHPSERAFGWRAAVHSLDFLLPNLAAVWFRARSRRVAFTRAVIAGVIAGLRRPPA
ncbi:MAG: glycosyltransferase [Thermoplasmata archaeon]|nr:glycosyltransferase [Thermoplasmata archaeon]